MCYAGYLICDLHERVQNLQRAGPLLSLLWDTALGQHGECPWSPHLFSPYLSRARLIAFNFIVYPDWYLYPKFPMSALPQGLIIDNLLAKSLLTPTSSIRHSCLCAQGWNSCLWLLSKSLHPLLHSVTSLPFSLQTERSVQNGVLAFLPQLIPCSFFFFFSFF